MYFYDYIDRLIVPYHQANEPTCATSGEGTAYPFGTLEFTPGA